MTVFYFCPQESKPVGGIKQIFRHVEALNEVGFDAYVLTLDGKKPSWFASGARIAKLKRSKASWASIFTRHEWNPLAWLSLDSAPYVEAHSGFGTVAVRRLNEEDIVVLPEFYGKYISQCNFGSRLVIFNQNAHYTFNHFSYDDGLNEIIYRDNLLAALSVSIHTSDYLRYAFPKLDVHLTLNGIDAERFCPGAVKRQQIAFMPRKLPHDIVQVLQILKCRGVLNDWSLCPIDAVSEDDVAKMLGESAIFLSTCQSEGFGLPPLEAAACGCIVIGYTGEAAKQFMLPEYCFPIEQGNVLLLAATLERVIKEYEDDPREILAQAMRFSLHARDKYSKVVEKNGVIEAWTRIIAAKQSAMC